ncbi:MAG: alpha/beta hydrolase [Gammaproteobacteria bacterium]|nr:alpha/beta hydrolase [Gammaproteobacteria bacterium]
MQILFVHGGSHDENCWDHIKPYFSGGELNIHTITLCGHGSNRLHGYRVSMSTYVQDVCCKAEQIGGPCVLVGHSMAGMVISAAAEARPDLFCHLIYVAAMVPERKGSRLITLATKYSNREAKTIAKINFFSGTFSLDHNRVKEVFYNECEGISVQLAERYLCQQPIRPFLSSVKWTQDKLGSIAKDYIECSLDKVMSIKDQRAMQKHMHFSRIKTLVSDHSPFISMPDKFFMCIAKLVK